MPWADLTALLRLRLVADGVRDPGQEAAGEHRHAHAIRPRRLQSTGGRLLGNAAKAAGEFTHNARHASARVHADALSVHGELSQLLAEVAARRVGKTPGGGDAILLQLPEAHQRLLKVVVGKVLASRGEALQSDMRGASRPEKGS